MVTPELLSYIRGELAKGRTREEIHATLVSQGGWTESDLSEAFRTVMPMGSSVHNVASSSSISKPGFSHTTIKVIVALLIIALFGVWQYRSELMSVWNSVIDSSEDSTINTSQAVGDIKNCGVGVAPKLGASLSESDPVVSCLSAAAINCENATALLQDNLFPTIFQIIKSGDSCNFRLSYPTDSTLVDLANNKLASQSVSCPVSIVKAIDNTNPNAPKFIAPSNKDLSVYANQIYLYGTLGLFIENNLDKNKITSLGCSGPYIDSVIASYNAQNKK